MPTSQALALFAKMIVRISKQLQDIQKEAISAELPERQQVLRNLPSGDTSGQQGTDNWQPMATTVEEDLEEVVDEETKKQRALQRELIDSMDLTKLVSSWFTGPP
jgi:N-acetyltransferase 10